MRNVKKLLVPIDFSPESEKALKYASSLATEINAELVALYVVEDILEEGFLAYTFPPEGYSYLDAQTSARPLDALLHGRSISRTLSREPFAVKPPPRSRKWCASAKSMRKSSVWRERKKSISS